MKCSVIAKIMLHYLPKADWTLTNTWRDRRKLAISKMYLPAVTEPQANNCCSVNNYDVEWWIYKTRK